MKSHRSTDIMSLRGSAEGVTDHYAKRPFVYPDRDERIRILAYEHDFVLMAAILYLEGNAQWPISMEDLPNPKGKSDEQRLADILEHLKELGFENVDAQGAQYLNS